MCFGSICDFHESLLREKHNTRITAVVLTPQHIQNGVLQRGIDQRLHVIDFDILVRGPECIGPATAGEPYSGITLGHLGKTAVCLRDARDSADTFDQVRSDRRHQIKCLALAHSGRNW